MSAVCDVSTVGLHTLSAVATPGSLSILAGLYTLVSSHQPGLVRSHMIHTGLSQLSDVSPQQNDSDENDDERLSIVMIVMM